MTIPFFTFIIYLQNSPKGDRRAWVWWPQTSGSFSKKMHKQVPCPLVWGWKERRWCWGTVTSTHVFSVCTFNSTNASYIRPTRTSLHPHAPFPPYLSPSPICVNENAWLYLESADVTSGFSDEPITVGAGRCDSLPNPGLLHWRTGICWITQKTVSTHSCGSVDQLEQFEIKSASSFTF